MSSGLCYPSTQNKSLHFYRSSSLPWGNDRTNKTMHCLLFSCKEWDWQLFSSCTRCCSPLLGSTDCTAQDVVLGTRNSGFILQNKGATLLYNRGENRIHFLHLKPLPSPLPWHMLHRSSSSYMKIKLLRRPKKKKKSWEKSSQLLLFLWKKKKKSHSLQYIGKKGGFGFIFKSDFKFLF